MIRKPVVFIVDDEQDMRAALVRLFRTAEIEAVPFADPESFLAAVRPDWTGCILLDVRMPGMDGLTVQAQLRARSIALPIVFLTGAADVPIAVRAMHAGAADFLEKPFDNATLVQCVRRALFLGDTAREQALLAVAIEQRISTLTPREREVMDHVVAGAPTKEIAESLSLSPRTVEIHRSRIMDKMDAKTTADLVRLVLTVRMPQGERSH